jgi:uncharacterized membrane protein
MSKLIAFIIGIVVVLLALSAFMTYSIGLFFDYPFTWNNVGKTLIGWIALNIALSTVFGHIKSSK